jgi:hypothetical protein
MTASTAWASREVPAALSAERLAALVDRALDRCDGLLFTATPREELDEIGRWQRLADLAWAGQVRAVVAAWNRVSAQERQFAGDEVALALGVSPTTGAGFVHEALAACELPGLMEAVEAGCLTSRHVRAVLRELGAVDLTVEVRAAIVILMLARYRGEAPGELAALVRRLILTVDRAAAEARRRKADRRRQVRYFSAPDGQASVWATGPAAMIAAIRASLDATLPLHTDEGDERSTDERVFDLFVDLLTGGATAGSWTAGVVVPFSTATGGELELAELPGFGPVLPSTAQELLGSCASVVQIAVDEHGEVTAVGDPVPVTEEREVLAMSEHDAPVTPPRLDPVAVALRQMARAPESRDLATPSYRIPRRLRRLVEARDRRCVFPGCHRPAAKTDLDHRIPWPRGRTAADNLQCLCRHHHRAKQAVFEVDLDDEGNTLWVTRGGWVFVRRRQGY